MQPKHREQPDFFFPVALITAGAVWLMINQGLIAQQNLVRLLPLWPLLLILGGLSLILRQLWWPLPSLLWLAAGTFVIWVLVNPQNILPAAAVPEFRQETFQETLGEAQSANVVLDLSVNPTTIHALSTGEDLIVANVHHPGDMNLEVNGSTNKTIRLGETSDFDWVNWNWIAAANQQPWDIGLTSEIPLDLEVDSSIGDIKLELAELQLNALNLDASTGGITVSLPEDSPHFSFVLNQSTGGVRIDAPEKATFDLDVDGSTGGLTIDVADNAGVQVEIRDDGPGSLNLPAGFEKVEQSEDDADEGVWQNKAFSTTDYPITITVDLSTGSVTIR